VKNLKEELQQKDKDMIETLENHKDATKEEFVDMTLTIKKLEKVRFFLIKQYIWLLVLILK